MITFAEYFIHVGGAAITPEKLKQIASQVLGGKQLHETDFGDPTLSVDEKLALVDLALKHYPAADPDC